MLHVFSLVLLILLIIRALAKCIFNVIGNYGNGKRCFSNAVPWLVFWAASVCVCVTVFFLGLLSEGGAAA